MRRSLFLFDSAIGRLLVKADALRVDYVEAKKVHREKRIALKKKGVVASPTTPENTTQEGEAPEAPSPRQIQQLATDGPFAEAEQLLKTDPLYSAVLTGSPLLKKNNSGEGTSSDDDDLPTPEELANMLATCAYFNCENVELINALLVKITSFHARTLDPVVITRTMASCARLGFANNEALLKLVGAAKYREVDFDGRTAARMIIAMGRFQFETTAVFRQMVQVLEREGVKNLTAKEAREVLYFLHESPMPRNTKRRLITHLCSVIVRRWTQRKERVTAQDMNFTVEVSKQFGIEAPWLHEALFKITKGKGIVVDHGGDTSEEDSVQFDAISVDRIKLNALMR